MQVPIGWLKELINHDYDAASLQKTLTSIGLEAEMYKPEPLDFSGVVIGKIVSRDTNPDGRGFFYTVEVGGAFAGGVASIYSTIPELEAGVKYPVALPGGHVGALEITERDYKTFVSHGKFCCATELGLTRLEIVEHADGSVTWVDGLEDVDGRALSIFPDCSELEIGTDLAAWLLDDPAVTIELTSNRADCHSMIGVAREMQVVTGSDMVMPMTWGEFEETSGVADEISIRIDDPSGCSLYAGMVIDKIRIAPSPLWMAKKLFSVGLRPISNMVDITNLVLYELGQPLHAFDHSLLKDSTIIVRRAGEGETMATIDGVVRNLTPSDLVIADSSVPVAIAGVMGGYASEVTGKTRKVLIESAWFDPKSVRRTSQRLALRTEAAIRFERGVDPSGIVRAVHRVAYLVKLLKAGEISRQIAVAREGGEEKITIPLTEEKIAAILGEEIPTGQIETILYGLGFELNGYGPSWNVTVPSFRRDIFIAEDIIEEIARHVGYDNLPEELPMVHMKSGLIDDDIRLRFEIKTGLAGLGLWELNSFPMCGESSVKRPNPLLSDVAPVKLMNPITEDAAYLRVSLVPGICDTYIRNLKRGAPIHDVFEVGKVYWHDGVDFREHREIIIGCLGERTGKQKLRNREKGFLRLKGYVEIFLNMAGISSFDIVADNPGDTEDRLFKIVANDEQIGAIELIHENTLGGETFERTVFTATFPWITFRDAYMNHRENKIFRRLPIFPAADRDLAFVLDESVSFGSMLKAIHEGGGKRLLSVELFDLYRGAQVGENKKNIAVNLRFRDPDKTLTDAEVDGWIEKIVALVIERTGGKLRDW